MLGDMLNTNKRKDVKTRIDQILFYGKKYVQDPRTGYYVCTSTKSRTRLHVAIWSHENKMEVPKGYVIHHIDWDKTNNDISNLTCVSIFGHSLIHNPPKKGSKYRVKIVPGGMSEVIDTTWLTEGD